MNSRYDPLPKHFGRQKRWLIIGIPLMAFLMQSLALETVVHGNRDPFRCSKNPSNCLPAEPVLGSGPGQGSTGGEGPGRGTGAAGASTFLASLRDQDCAELAKKDDELQAKLENLDKNVSEMEADKSQLLVISNALTKDIDAASDRLSAVREQRDSVCPQESTGGKRLGPARTSSACATAREKASAAEKQYKDLVEKYSPVGSAIRDTQAAIEANKKAQAKVGYYDSLVQQVQREKKCRK